MDASSIVGTSGHIALHMIPTDNGDPRFVLEHIELGELIDLPDLATAREVSSLLNRAIMLAEIQAIIANRVRSLRNGRNL